MFNLFKRKEPEKKKPDFIGEEHQHKKCIIVFKNSKAFEMLDSLKKYYEKISIIEGKEQDRMISMLESGQQLIEHSYDAQHHCIAPLYIGTNPYEILANSLQGNKPPMEGFGICPKCLHIAIIACEEVVIALKDIEQATKEWV